jgi:hypothetical protein
VVWGKPVNCYPPAKSPARTKTPLDLAAIAKHNSLGHPPMICGWVAPQRRMAADRGET